MAQSPVRNPYPLVEQINPEPKLSRQQKAIARRIERFEAQRAQEEKSMPATVPGIKMTDLNPMEHQRKVSFTPTKKPTVPPRPDRPSVQHIQAMPVAPSNEPSIFDEMKADLLEAAPEPAASPTPAQPTGEEDADIESILARFKGTPEEKARAVAKSYKEAEKRMRHLENERKLFTTGQPVQAQPGQQPVQPVVQNSQVAVTPSFDYKRAKEKILDEPDAILQDFEKHLVAKNGQVVSNLLGPLYEEVLNGKLMRKFPDVITEENLDVVKAMAHNEPGDNAWDKLVNAATKYKNVTTGTITPKQDPEVLAMQDAAQTPSPQARTSGEKKMWKESTIRAEMQKRMKSGEYQRDRTFRNLVEKAYAEGRVLKGQ